MRWNRQPYVCVCMPLMCKMNVNMNVLYHFSICIIEHGNPGDVPSIYSGTVTDFTNSDPVIYRPSLHRPNVAVTVASPTVKRVDEDRQATFNRNNRGSILGHTSSTSSESYRLLRTEPDLRWLNGQLQFHAFACVNSITWRINRFHYKCVVKLIARL